MNLKQALGKVQFTPSHQILFGIVANIDRTTKQPGKRLTMDEVHEAYDKKTKKRHKEGSVTTLLSQMRGEWEKATGMKYPQALDIARGVGGGRASNRASGVDVLSDVLGEGFDLDEIGIELESVPSEDNASE